MKLQGERRKEQGLRNKEKGKRNKFKVKRNKFKVKRRKEKGESKNLKIRRRSDDCHSERSRRILSLIGDVLTVPHNV
ncbi:hypothetical protein BZG01_04325 [Labilibaculum manganireducens]|uniref:Uncharacterized protein n=1 Tax=Labilibaculum manganireducens TaxID=1940525 RepID=A0A2N3IDR5_9BACT|nr:hypothetical protein BZG01_04325 [Labilibaculum manganireducens]